MPHLFVLWLVNGVEEYIVTKIAPGRLLPSIGHASKRLDGAGAPGPISEYLLMPIRIKEVRRRMTLVAMTAAGPHAAKELNWRRDS